MYVNLSNMSHCATGQRTAQCCAPDLAIKPGLFGAARFLSGPVDWFERSCITVINGFVGVVIMFARMTVRTPVVCDA